MAFSLGPNVRRKHHRRFPCMLCLTAAGTLACGSDDASPDVTAASDASMSDASTGDASATDPDASTSAADAASDPDAQPDSGQASEFCEFQADGTCEAGCWALDGLPFDAQRGCWLPSEVIVCSESVGGSDLGWCYVRKSDQRMYSTPAIYGAFENSSEFRSCTDEERKLLNDKGACKP